ncbi:hypothetical protein [Serratia marcescens]|uniref:hypothetical protein n=1 Tax=Serratia marcescens TaxID=615 RepID=UPI0019814E11|nr:hypothetical protein [Serratia marcescens]MBN3978560.1 hypothetical protein [Serratia marcescens]
MSEFKKEKLNPLLVIESQFCIKCEHIAYNKNMRKSDAHYQIIRQCSHDGTMAFTSDLLYETVINLVSKRSYSKRFPPEKSKEVVDIKYTVGPIWLSTVYGEVELPAGKCPGQRQRTRMSVFCEYIYANDLKDGENG